MRKPGSIQEPRGKGIELILLLSLLENRQSEEVA